jgi:LCP family protein required for cell wall assembly
MKGEDRKSDEPRRAGRAVGIPALEALVLHRRWPRRVLVTVNVIVASCLLMTMTVYGYVSYETSKLKTIRLPGLVANGSDGLAPMNILLVGSNTRTGLDPTEAGAFGSARQVPGARSDVTMVLHLDPKSGTASLLSIPRDLFVPLPPGSMAGKWGKIDAALNDGPNNLITAISTDLGIAINHYVEVNFDGFQRTIDAIGGIRMDFPMPLRDPLSNLQIPQTGCQKLNGAKALAVVRARHLQYFTNGRWVDDPQSDLARIRRDHTFLRIFVASARAQTSSPLRLNGLANGLLAQVTVDSSLNVHTLLGLFRHYHRINIDAVPETTLPITIVSNYHYAGGLYGDVDFPVEPLDRQVIDNWQGTVPLSSTIPPMTTVNLVNASGSIRKSSAVAAQLGSAGFEIGSVVSEPRRAVVTETLIHYHPGDLKRAQALSVRFAGAIMLEQDPSAAVGQLQVELGSVAAVTAPSATIAAPQSTNAPTKTTSGSTPPPASAVPTALGQPPSSAQDQAQPFDPTPCPAPTGP